MSLILIIESSRLMAEAATEALGAAGFEVLPCLSVAEAIVAVQERRPDLVVTEYLVAEATGLDFLERLTRLENAPPVVMVTGLGNEDAAALALARGAWSYVLKTENYLRELPDLARRILDDIGAWQKSAEKDRVRSRLAAQNELAGWLAHNFKNILAASIGYLNLINFKNQNQDPAKREEYLAESRKGQETAILLLERLISLTEAEAEAEVERVIAAEVADEAWGAAKKAVLAAIADQYPERLAAAEAEVGQVILMNSARRLAPLNFVRNDLFSIFQALFQNSLEATLTAENPRVLVTGELKERKLELTIKDNGRGMSEDVLRHALEPLFSTKGEVGVGLSLSLVSALVERHGGALELKSAPDAGTTVKFTLDIKG